MNDSLRILLESKLDDPDPVVRAHARARLAAAASYPTITTQAVNLAGALADWASSGFALADEEEQGRRLSICEACPSWDSTQGRCQQCGCWTAAKVMLASSRCPIDQW